MILLFKDEMHCTAALARMAIVGTSRPWGRSLASSRMSSTMSSISSMANIIRSRRSLDLTSALALAPFEFIEQLVDLLSVRRF